MPTLTWYPRETDGSIVDDTSDSYEDRYIYMDGSHTPSTFDDTSDSYEDRYIYMDGS